MARFCLMMAMVKLSSLFISLLLFGSIFQMQTTRWDGYFIHQGFDLSEAIVHDIELPEPSSWDVRDAELFYLWQLYEFLPNNSETKIDTLAKIKETVEHRQHTNNTIDFIRKVIFGLANGPFILKSVRPSRVDDSNCWIPMSHIYELHYGVLTIYEFHMSAFENICSRGVRKKAFKRASVSACPSYNITKWSPLIHGYSFEE